jgi:tRNA pseudouridine38-40 synthase
VWNSPVVEPLLSDLTWHVPFSLDIDAMNHASEALVGEHDFTSFCRVPDVPESGLVPSMRRRVLDLGWRRRVPSELLLFEIRGTAFCHQMVRSIVGTLVDIGRGRIDADALPAILGAQNRAQAGQVAPPHGLVLWDVGYDDVGEVQQAPLSSQGSAAGKDRDDSE